MKSVQPAVLTAGRRSYIHFEEFTRSAYSEGEILQVHDAVYSPIKSSVAVVRDSIYAALAETRDPSISASATQTAIVRLRELLNQGAIERALQDELINSGLLQVTANIVAQEVTMQATDDHRGMRMDVLVESADSTQIIELKRGSHMLLTKRGTLSAELLTAVKQTTDYGHRIHSDPEASKRINERHGIQIHNPQVRLIAGRRLSVPSEYSLLTQAESKSAPGLQLRIYTWDGFLAELERILD
jgi:hypothetical protein